MKKIITAPVIALLCVASFAVGRQTTYALPQLAALENERNRTVEIWSQNTAELVAEYEPEDGELYKELRTLLHERTGTVVGEPLQVASAR